MGQEYHIWIAAGSGPLETPAVPQTRGLVCYPGASLAAEVQGWGVPLEGKNLASFNSMPLLPPAHCQGSTDLAEWPMVAKALCGGRHHGAPTPAASGVLPC